MEGAFILLLLLGGSSLSTVSAFPDGNVIHACSEMRPDHALFSPMLTPPPFSVNSSNSTYVAGQEITVTLQANDGNVFRGFLLQALVADSGAGPVGTFSVTGNETQLLNCTTISSAVSHTSRSDKITVNATWTAPENEFRDIEFRATFVQNHSTFWVRVPSSRILFTGIIPNTTVAVPSSSTLVPNTTIAVPSSSTLVPNTTMAVPESASTEALNVTVVLNTTVTPNTVGNTPSTTTNSSPPLSFSSLVLLLLSMMLLMFLSTH